MLQLKILTIDSRLLFVPTSLTRLSIDEAKHKLYVQSFQEETPNLPVHLHKDTGIIRLVFKRLTVHLISNFQMWWN